ncbi:hypothetical protein PMAYCL1PPCAC_18586 [Pristionchus mayeri]|uniref:Uncharacterized protein n=1 Tax=Pristionchus mayeri TaxID=1317129 RepID=A0AAN5I271_9BILA|nr:hypothetical protein PMAYCL1PPCAC_18586 [Pristionchus mayeri]
MSSFLSCPLMLLNLHFSILRMEGIGWANGIVAGFSQVDCGTFYFVYTPLGIGVMHPRIHENNDDVELGAYLRVLLYPPRSNGSNMEIEGYELNRKPVDHEVEVQRNAVEIKCNVKFMRQHNAWFIFYNDYLGLLALRGDGENGEKNIRVGCVYRVGIRRAKTAEEMSSDGQPVVWIVHKIDFAERPQLTSRWFDGIVTKSTDNFLLITCPNICSDVCLNNWKSGIHLPTESILGRWLKVQIDNRRSGEFGIRYNAMSYFTEAEPMCKTRVISGLAEVRIPCQWNGEIEDSRALLQSEIGLIRDHEGLIDTSSERAKGEYQFWVVKHFRQNHTARWKLSIYDNVAKKINETNWAANQWEERVEHTTENPQNSLSHGPPSRCEKDGRVIHLMNRLMKAPLMEECFLANDKEAALRVREILDRYARKNLC